MAKRQKKSVLTFFKGRGITLVAVVMLAASAGTFMLPKIFADTAALHVDGVSVAASNDANYNIYMTWTGATSDHWHVLIYRSGSLIYNWTNVTTRSRSITKAVCGAAYEVRVQAVAANGSVSSYKTDTGSTRCPGVAWVTYHSSSNNIVSSWKSTSGFAQSYNYYLKTNSGGFVASSTTATSRTITGTCGTNYYAYLIPYANGQYGPATPTTNAATAACPAPKPAPKPTPAPAPKPTPAPAPTSTPAKPTTTTTKPKATAKSGSSTASNSAAPAVSSVPSTPDNFSAETVSKKIVNLQWDASSNADHYVLRRSVDNATWVDLATVTETTYSDESTVFNTTYYYQLQAVSGDGKTSETVTAQTATEAFAATNDTLTSPDKRVKVVIPTGAIDGDHSCSVSSSTKGLTKPPTGQRLVLGPYDLVCVTVDGEVVSSFAEPVKVTMKVTDVAKGYKDITLHTITDDTAWKTQKASYDDKSQQLSFTLASTKTFAAYGVKQKSILGIILTFFLILLLLGGILAGYLFWWRRRRTPEHVAQVQQQISAEDEFRQALAKPDCTHLGMAQQVMPSGQGCLECEQQGTQWNGLRICLICGHVGCSDDSPQQHSLKHFQETGHPIIYDYGDPNGNSIGWCYVDQTYI